MAGSQPHAWRRVSAASRSQCHKHNSVTTTNTHHWHTWPYLLCIHNTNSATHILAHAWAHMCRSTRLAAGLAAHTVCCQQVGIRTSTNTNPNPTICRQIDGTPAVIKLLCHHPASAEVHINIRCWLFSSEALPRSSQALQNLACVLVVF
jgi:hypothetical protein